MTHRSLRHLRKDPILREVIRRVKLPPFTRRPDHFRTLVQSIIGQQLSDKAASTIIARFQGIYGRFPTARDVLRTPDPRMRAAGVSGQKISYLKDLSRRVEDGTLDLKGLGRLSDEEVMTKLTVVKGIGPWTAEMFLIFSLHRPDVFSSGDLGLKNALRKLYRLRSPANPARIKRITDPWRPYRSLACRYLWASLDLKDDR